MNHSTPPLGQTQDPAAYIRDALDQAPLFPDRPHDAAGIEIARVGVVGSGTMGTGIAIAFLDADMTLALFDQDATALQRGIAKIAGHYETQLAKGRIDAAQRDARLARLTTAGNLADLADCDLVVEAVFESLAVKRDLFALLDAVVRPGAILVTNTSYLDVDVIAAATARPEDVVGLHFFSPANIMRLVEIVRGRLTSPHIVAAAVDLVTRIGKVGVIARVGYGFIGNRMLQAYVRQANLLLIEGAFPQQVDEALTGFGFAMGPFQVADMSGLDISYRARRERTLTNEEVRAFAVADGLVESGRLGLKTGKGFYDYAEGSRKPIPSDFIADLIEMEANRLGVARRDIAQTEIVERCLFALVNEGLRLLQEGIAMRASDVDLVYLNGYGFPAARGGPLYWAEHAVGLRALRDGLTRYRQATGLDSLAPADLLVQLIESERTLTTLPA